MESRTPKVDSKTPENQCCAATVEEMCAATLGHYDDISTKARHWSNQVPQAIKFWYLEKPKLELALAAAEKRIETIQKDNCSLSDIGEALEQRAEAAEARAREAEKDAEWFASEFCHLMDRRRVHSLSREIWYEPMGEVDKRACEYLERTGKLEHHPDHPTWVRHKEHEKFISERIAALARGEQEKEKP